MTRRVTEPLIYTDSGPILVTYNVPCHCVREKLKERPCRSS